MYRHRVTIILLCVFALSVFALPAARFQPTATDPSVRTKCRIWKGFERCTPVTSPHTVLPVHATKIFTREQHTSYPLVEADQKQVVDFEELPSTDGLARANHTIGTRCYDGGATGHLFKTGWHVVKCVVSLGHTCNRTYVCGDTDGDGIPDTDKQNNTIVQRNDPGPPPPGLFSPGFTPMGQVPDGFDAAALQPQVTRPQPTAPMATDKRPVLLPADMPLPPGAQPLPLPPGMHLSPPTMPAPRPVLLPTKIPVPPGAIAVPIPGGKKQLPEPFKGFRPVLIPPGVPMPEGAMKMPTPPKAPSVKLPPGTGQLGTGIGAMYMNMLMSDPRFNLTQYVDIEKMADPETGESLYRGGCKPVIPGALFKLLDMPGKVQHSFDCIMSFGMHCPKQQPECPRPPQPVYNKKHEIVGYRETKEEYLARKKKEKEEKAAKKEAKKEEERERNEEEKAEKAREKAEKKAEAKREKAEKNAEKERKQDS